MDNRRLTRIEDKLDKMHETLVELKVGYDEHERRSIANEEAVKVLKDEIHLYTQIGKYVFRAFMWVMGSAGVWKGLDALRRLL